jgi:hypothetical protein
MTDPNRYALVDGSGRVVNIILWDGTPIWAPPPGLDAVRDEAGEAAIGGTWDGSAFHAAEAAP